MEMSKTITIKFLNFWNGFDPEKNKFTDALRAKFDVVALDSDGNETPDILFYSPTGKKSHHKYDCLKIYWTGENDVPDFNQFDYAISHRNIDIDGRHLRYPLYNLYEEWERILNPADIDTDAAYQRGFCTAVIKNSLHCDRQRLRILDLVESYKPITYGGRFRNNTGGCVEDKMSFISKYKFNLALENSSVPGYVTEKLMEALAARTVPIYWGAPDVAADFNPEAFMNFSDYDSTDSFVRALKRIDNDREEYVAMLKSPAIIADKHTDHDAALSEFLCGIATSMKRHTEKGGWSGRLMKRSSHWHWLYVNDRINNLAERITKIMG